MRMLELSLGLHFDASLCVAEAGVYTGLMVDVVTTVLGRTPRPVDLGRRGKI